MQNAIKKGTEVYVFDNYDHKGTVCYRKYTVGSWGKVQGHLIKGTGANAEWRVRLANLNTVNGGYGTYIVPVALCDDPEAYAINLAACFLEAYREHFALRMRPNGSEPGAFGRVLADGSPDVSHPFTACMVKGLAELHEPRCVALDAAKS